MKLPDNPTEAQILAVTGLVIKSIYTRGTVAVQTLDLDSQGRLTGIFLGDGVRFRYTIDNGILSYAPVNPKDLPSEEGVSLSEDALDFARLKIAGNTKQEKKCKVGYACGYSCISQNRNCKKALPGQAKNGAEWVKMQREKEAEASQKKQGKSMELPKLEGSEKQIAWAEKIRSKIIEDLGKQLDYDKERLAIHLTKNPPRPKVIERYQTRIPKADLFLQNIAQQSQAAWWIDNRKSIYDDWYDDIMVDGRI